MSSDRVHHRGYKCSGIQYCEYAHKDILSVYEAFDRVELKNIDQLRQMSSHPHVSLPIDERIRENTERLDNKFLMFKVNIL